MGLVWDYVDSANFQSRLRRNLDAWDTGLAQWNSRLQTVISYLGYGPGAALSSEAYNTVKTLFQDRILPIVTSGQSACTWTRIHLSEYTADETPLLDDGGRVEEDSVQASVDSLDKQIHDLTHIEIFPGLWFHEWWTDHDDDVVNLQASRNAIYDELQELRTFSAAVNGLFDDEIDLIKYLTDAIVSINHGTLSSDGSYVPAFGDNESWLPSIQQYNEIHPPHPKPVFDPNGQYGGNQGSPFDQWIKGSPADRQLISDLIHQYYPNLTVFEIRALLDQLNRTGCGYTADVNSIVEHFANDPEAFEEAFGFPLYDESGNVNFNLILIDFWCFVQTTNPDIDPTGRTSGQTPGGIFPTGGDFLTDYLSNHGITITTSDVENATVADYERLSQLGSVSISLEPINLYDAAGNLVDNRDGFHAMIVTGTGYTADGRLYWIVSTWGEELRLYPDQYIQNTFDLNQDGILDTDSDGDGNLDYWTDTDGDGVVDTLVQYPTQFILEVVTFE